MRTSATLSRWSDVALALGLGLGVIIGAASIARAEPAATQTPAIASQLSDASKAAPEFTCQVPLGSWCDLRDWSGMDRAAPAVEQ
jgi:hypothetical protein